MFYNEQGKHVRTKKEILDDSGISVKAVRLSKREKSMNEPYLQLKTRCSSRKRMQWNHEADRALVSQVPYGNENYLH